MQSTAASLRQINSSKTEAKSKDSGPVEISFDLLKHVSGAGPRGGWDDPISAQAPDASTGPRGGWDTGSV